MSLKFSLSVLHADLTMMRNHVKNILHNHGDQLEPWTRHRLLAVSSEAKAMADFLIEHEGAVE